MIQPINAFESVLKTFENNGDPFIIIKTPKQKVIKQDVGYFEIIRVSNWGQLKLAGQIRQIYSDFLEYKDIVDGIVNVVNNNSQVFLKNIKLNDSVINAIVNISITTISAGVVQQILISTSKSEIIEFNGKCVSPSQLLEMRNNFTASVGHELRTPLTSITSMIELLSLTNLDAKQRDYISFLKSSSNQLLSIINDIMDYSKLEDNRTRLDNNPLNLRKCIESAFNIVAADFANIKIDYVSQIDSSCPLNVIGDEVKIIQILINLVKNSVKFSPDGSKVIVKLRSAGESVHGDMARSKFVFDVIDEGIGISAEDINKLFIPYSQLNQAAARKKHGGTGLGLIISKKLCNLMGGNISVTSEIGKGTTFTFSLLLEVNIVEAQYMQTNTEFASLIAGKNILVVDDTEAHRITLGQIIHSWGAKATMCSTPSEALAMVGIGSYNLGILDYSMPPHMNGRELSLELRKRNHNFPIVVLSSLNENIDGPFTLLFKPISKDRLEETIRNMLTPIVVSKSPMFTGRQTDMFGNANGKISPSSHVFHSISNEASISGRERSYTKSKSHKPDRILVVEDYDAIKFGIVESLHYIGYTNVDTASDGREAIKMVEKSKADKDDYKYIFMDIVMPVLDGISAVKEINKIYSAGRPTVIALTASVANDDGKKYLSADNGRMDFYMAKPTSIDKIREILNKH